MGFPNKQKKPFVIVKYYTNINIGAYYKQKRIFETKISKSLAWKRRGASALMGHGILICLIK